MTDDQREAGAFDVAAAYADERFVHVLPPGQWPQTKSTIGSNAVHVQVTVDEAAGRLVAVGVVDNLAKGTGGAAVQCLNLALGLDEGRVVSPLDPEARVAALRAIWGAGNPSYARLLLTARAAARVPSFLRAKSS